MLKILGKDLLRWDFGAWLFWFFALPAFPCFLLVYPFSRRLLRMRRGHQTLSFAYLFMGGREKNKIAINDELTISLYCFLFSARSLRSLAASRALSLSLSSCGFGFPFRGSALLARPVTPLSINFLTAFQWDRIVWFFVIRFCSVVQLFAAFFFFFSARSLRECIDCDRPSLKPHFAQSLCAISEASSGPICRSPSRSLPSRLCGRLLQWQLQNYGRGKAEKIFTQIIINTGACFSTLSCRKPTADTHRHAPKPKSSCFIPFFVSFFLCVCRRCSDWVN